MFIALLISMMACSMVSASDSFLQFELDGINAHSCSDDSSSLPDGELVGFVKRSDESSSSQSAEQMLASSSGMRRSEAHSNLAHYLASFSGHGMQRSVAMDNLAQYDVSENSSNEQFEQMPANSYFDGCMFKFDDHEELSPANSLRGAAASSSGMRKSVAVYNLKDYAPVQQQSFKGSIPCEVNTQIKPVHLLFVTNLLSLHLPVTERWQDKVNHFGFLHRLNKGNVQSEMKDRINSLIALRIEFNQEKQKSGNQSPDLDIICGAKKAYGNPIVSENGRDIEVQWSNLELLAWKESEAASRMHNAIDKIMNKRLTLPLQTKRSRR